MPRKKLLLIILIFGVILVLVISSLLLIKVWTTDETLRDDDTTSEEQEKEETVPIPSDLFKPTDLGYKGAFRLPQEDISEAQSWSWGGSSATYYPKGDSGGENDGYPGSIFTTGNDIYQYVAEINIPVPIISEAKDLEELNTAEMLQDFVDIKGDMFGELEIPRVGLEYLPKQEGQTSDKLYFAWGQHMQELDAGASHGWFELDLSKPQVQGPWKIKDRIKYETTDYIFTIPDNWADEYINGMKLATGRFRDGGQGTQGPSIIAYAPWQDGNPPQENAELTNIPLLLYSSVYDNPEGEDALENYLHSDMWSGGAWITLGDKAVVLIAGIKGKGECWYGYSDGTVWPEEGPYPTEGSGERGWWSSDFVAEFLFYDPEDFTKVAQGEMETYEPQPYAVMEIDDYFYNVQEDEFRYLGGIGYDRERNFLYVFEYRGDKENDNPLVHVWYINS